MTRIRLMLAVSALLLLPATAVPPAEAHSAGGGSAAGGPPAMLVAAAPSPADVTGDDENDLYVGTGGLVIPGRDWHGDPGGRRESATCTGCRWRITRLCSKADFAAGHCPAIHIGCPVGTIAVRIWLAPPGEPWRVVGESCQGSTPPRTLTEVGIEVRERVDEALPELRAGVQPSSGVLLGIPAVFRTGQSARGIRGADLSVLGLDIALDARVRWRWDFGDGTTRWTTSPGGRWPDTSVSHTYRRAAQRTATVTAVWRGEYVVEGLGPFAVPGPPLTQGVDLTVDVRAARSVLVD